MSAPGLTPDQQRKLRQQHDAQVAKSKQGKADAAAAQQARTVYQNEQAARVVPAMPAHAHNMGLDPAGKAITSGEPTTAVARRAAQKDQGAAAKEFLRQGNAGKGDANRQRQVLAHRGGSAEAKDVAGSGGVDLLLRGLGYTGNGPQQFNTDVQRANLVYRQVFGHDPTPAALLDIMRSPAAQDHESLRILLSGGIPGSEIDQYMGATAQQIHGLQLPALTAEQRRKESYRRAISHALWQSNQKGGGGAGTILNTVNTIATRQNAYQAIAWLNQSKTTDSEATRAYTAQAMSSVMPISGATALDIVGAKEWAQKNGVAFSDGASFAQNTAVVKDQVAALKASVSSGAAGGAGAAAVGIEVEKANHVLDTLATTKAFQEDMIKTFHLDKAVKATGILDKTWADIISKYQSNSAYNLITQATSAQSAGFGRSFDPFKSVDPNTGKWANNSDGRNAQEAITRYANALQTRTTALEQNSTGKYIIGALPLQAWDQGGITGDAQLGNGGASLYLGAGDYALGGSEQQLSDHWDNRPAWQGVISVATDSPLILEHGVVRSVSMAFGQSMGVLQQTKADTFAFEALTGAQGTHWDEWNKNVKMARDRLQHDNPTWANIIDNDPNAREHLAGLVGDQGALALDYGSNVILDFVVTKRVGPWQGDFVRFARAKHIGADGMLTRAAVMTDSRMLEDTHESVQFMRNGDAANANKALRDVNAEKATGTRYWMKDDTAPGGFKRVPVDHPDMPAGRGRASGPPLEPKKPADGSAPPPQQDPSLPDTAVIEDAHPVEMPATFKVPEVKPPNIGTPARPVPEGGAVGGLRSRIAEGGTPAEAAPAEAPASLTSGGWEKDAPVGKVGNSGATFQVHRLTNEEGQAIKRVIIRQPHSERAAEVGNETHVDIKGDAAQVKWTRSTEAGKGHVERAYVDALHILDEMGIYKLMRDVRQSKAGKRIWEKVITGTFKLPKGFHYENGAADAPWHLHPGSGSDLSTSAVESGDKGALDISHADLGYIAKDGTTGAEEQAAARARAMGKQNAEDQGLPVIDTEAAQAEDINRRYSLYELVNGGHVSDEFAHNAIVDEAVLYNQAFGVAKARTVPYNSRAFFERFDPESKVPLGVIHPVAWTRDNVWRHTADAFDNIDRRWEFDGGRYGMGGKLRAVTRELRRQFTRAANWREMPVHDMEVQAINRLAHDAGLSVNKQRALAERFLHAKANEDPADMLAIRNELGEAYIKQGRDGSANAVEKIFSVSIDRTGERALWHHVANEDPEVVFGPGGLAEGRQWSSLSAVVDGVHTTKRAQRAVQKQLARDIHELGLRPIAQEGHYGGEPEMSFLVPGLTPAEAIKLGQKYNQHSIVSNQGLFGAAEHTWDPATKSFTAPNPLHGKVVEPTGGYTVGPDAVNSGGYSETKLGDQTAQWNLNLPGWDEWESVAKPVTNKHLIAKNFGEIKPLTQKQHLNNAYDLATSDQERETIQSLLDVANDKPSPILPEEIMQNFSVPEAGLPKTPKGVVGRLQWLNNAALAVSAVNRRLILVTDPMLYFKHATADTMRRVLAEGGLRQTLMNASGKEQAAFKDYLERNPKDAGVWNRLTNLTKNGELRFDVEYKGAAGGKGEASMFWTGDAVDKARRGRLKQIGHEFVDGRGVRLNPKRAAAADNRQLLTAAAYIDRRLMSGAYQAWKDGGTNAVEHFFLNTREGRLVAEQEGMPAEHLARMVDENMNSMTLHDPNFLMDAEEVRNNAIRAGEDTRKALAKWIAKEERNVPVSGHVQSEDFLNLGRQGFDKVTQDIVGAYLKMNKWNRDGLFRDMAAKHFNEFVKAGVPEEQAFTAATGIARSINRYHMLDLADALKVEQSFRWASYFFTKHRLYWTWLGETMKNRPELATALYHIQQGLNAHADPNDPSSAGKMVFNLPAPSFLSGFAGDRIKYVVPIARLFWLQESQANPGAIGLGWHQIGQGNWENAVPFSRNAATELTTVDTSFKYLWLNVDLRLGRINSTDAAESYLSPSEAYKFKLAAARMDASYRLAHNGQPMNNADLAAKTVQHMMIAGFWKGTGFSGGYIDDPARTPEQDKVWKQYNDAIDPITREKLRKANPWLDSMIGVYYSSSSQHSLGQTFFTRLGDMMTQHENRQDHLLREFKATGSAAFLFGPKWNKEGDRLSAEIDALKADAKAAGASDFLSAMGRDHFLGLRVKYAATLHDLYPGMSDTVVQKLAKSADPAWIKDYRHALDTTLTDAAIKKLPAGSQQGAYVLRSFYRSQLSAYSSSPSNQAEQLRRDYFDKVYGPYKTGQEKLWTKLAATPKAGQGAVFDQMLAYNIKHDHPVKVDGQTFPSAERVHWLFLPKDVQHSVDQRNSYKNWSWLTPFEKQRLGHGVSSGVSQGWIRLNAAIRAYERPDHSGTVSYPTEDQKLGAAQKLDKIHPGFYKDYLRSLQPAWVRMRDSQIGTAKSQKGWNRWFQQVDRFAVDLTGGIQPPRAGDAKALLAWGVMFRKTAFSNLMSRGIPGYFGGVPQGGPSGTLYRQAMNSPDPEFRAEFAQMVQDNPDFILTIFGTGG